MQFSVTSRYYELPTTKLGEDDEKPIIYLQRRFLPLIESPAMLIEHTVSEGDRLDNLAASYLGDAEQFWRLCDVNPVFHPNDLTDEIGRRMRIPLFLGD